MNFDVGGWRERLVSGRRERLVESSLHSDVVARSCEIAWSTNPEFVEGVHMSRESPVVLVGILVAAAKVREGV